MKATTVTRRYLSVEEVSVYTGLSLSTLYKLTMNSKLPCYAPTGAKMLFDKEEIDAWVKSAKRGPEVQHEAT